ncbi:MAG TPA: sodium:solute symporter family protein [Verrucomicrobiae bacterium]
MNWILTGVLVYVLIQLAIGLMVSRNIDSEEDYLLAGRSLGLGLATFSIFATWFGAETCISSAGMFYEQGFSGGAADPFGYGLCILFLGFVFAVPLWKRQLTTLIDLFRQRYSVTVERASVLLIAPTSIIWAAAQVRAFGEVISNISNGSVSVDIAILIATGVTIVYTVTGGLKADVMTDLVQGIIIIFSLVVIFIIVLAQIPDLSGAIREIEPERLNPFHGNGGLLEQLEQWMVPICGSVVAQELIGRVIATRSPEVARKSALIGGGIYILVGLIPAILGLLAFKMMPGIENPEHVLPTLAKEHLNTFMYVIFSGALVSAILSTVDSTLLSASALVSHNLIVPLVPGIEERGKILSARIMVVVSGLIAAWLALGAESVFELVHEASAMGSTGVFVIMVMALFSNFGGSAAALTSLGAGLLVYLAAAKYEYPYPFLISMLAAFGGYFLAGLIEHKFLGLKNTSPQATPAQGT